jgi:MFS family permease
VLIQAIGLVFGAIFVFAVGRAANVAFLMAAMTLFGVGKGFYDSGIFASLYDLIEPRARGTAAGIMNTVGWGGGALGPLAFGWIAKNGGRGSEVENMSHVFTICAYVYLAGAALLCVAMFLFARNTSYK